MTYALISLYLVTSTSTTPFPLNNYPLRTALLVGSEFTIATTYGSACLLISTLTLDSFQAQLYYLSSTFILVITVLVVVTYLLSSTNTSLLVV